MDRHSGASGKIEEMKRLYAQGEYESACRIADGLNFSKLKQNSDIAFLVKVYKSNGDYLTAKNILKKQYAKKSTRSILTDLFECSLETKEIEDAVRYYNELYRMGIDASTDLRCRYQIEKRSGCSISKLIVLLKELKNVDYLEEYAYELAKMYRKAGMEEECVAECDEIILWFGEGAAVERAKLLRKYCLGELDMDDIMRRGEEYTREKEERRIEEMAISAVSRIMAQDDIHEDTENNANAGETTEYGGEMTENGNQTIENYRETAESGKETIENVEEAIENDGETTENYGETTRNDEKSLLTRETKSGLTQQKNQIQDIESYSEPVEEFTQLSFLKEQKHWFDQREAYELYDETYEGVMHILPQPEGKFAKAMDAANVTLEEVFGTFVRMESVRKQLVRSLDVSIGDRSRCAYFVLTGERQSGKTTLGIRIATMFSRLGLLKAEQVAFISGEKLDEKKIAECGNRLQDRCILIEHAGSLSEAAVAALTKLSSKKEGPAVIILEDHLRNINKIMRYSEEMNALFSNRVHLPRYDESELMGFALEEIHHNGYEIDKLAAEKLRKKMTLIARENNERKLSSVTKLVKELTDRVDMRHLPKILDMARNASFEPGNYMVITEEDIYN